MGACAREHFGIKQVNGLSPDPQNHKDYAQAFLSFLLPSLLPIGWTVGLLAGAGAAAWSVTVGQSYGFTEMEVEWLCHPGSPGSRTLVQEGGGSLIGNGFCGCIL